MTAFACFAAGYVINLLCRENDNRDIQMSSPSDQAMLRESLKGVTEEVTYGGILSFMRRRYTRDLADADVAVLGIPLIWRPPLVPEADLARVGARGVSEPRLGA